MSTGAFFAEVYPGLKFRFVLSLKECALDFNRSQCFQLVGAALLARYLIG